MQPAKTFTCLCSSSSCAVRTNGSQQASVPSLLLWSGSPQRMICTICSFEVNKDAVQGNTQCQVSSARPVPSRDASTQGLGYRTADCTGRLIAHTFTPSSWVLVAAFSKTSYVASVCLPRPSLASSAGDLLSTLKVPIPAFKPLVCAVIKKIRSTYDGRESRQTSLGSHAPHQAVLRLLKC